MIVVHETLQVTGQAPFAEHDDVVQALAADGADHAFDISPYRGPGFFGHKVGVITEIQGD
jgi:hypothetical protein